MSDQYHVTTIMPSGSKVYGFLDAQLGAAFALAVRTLPLTLVCVSAAETGGCHHPGSMPTVSNLLRAMPKGSVPPKAA